MNPGPGRWKLAAAIAALTLSTVMATEGIKTRIFTGAIEPKARVEVRSNAAGRVARLPVHEGDQIKAGQVVAVIDGGGKREDVLAMRDGTVLESVVEVGQSVLPAGGYNGGTVLMVLGDLSGLTVDLDVGERSIARIALSQPAKVQVDAFSGTSLQGTVSFIAPQAMLNGRRQKVFSVKVELQPTEVLLRPGMTAHVEFLPLPIRRIAAAYRELRPGQVFVVQSRTRTTSPGVNMVMESVTEHRIDKVDAAKGELTYVPSTASAMGVGAEDKPVVTDLKSKSTELPKTISMFERPPVKPDGKAPEVQRISAEYEGGTLQLGCVHHLTVLEGSTVESWFAEHARTVSIPWGTRIRKVRLSFTKTVTLSRDPSDASRTLRTTTHGWTSDDLPEFAATVWFHVTTDGSMQSETTLTLVKFLDPAPMN